MPGMICIGAIAGAYGVHGQARIKSFCTEPETIADYNPLSDARGTRHFTLTITRAVTGGFAAWLEGVTTREQAQSLRGTQLFIARERLPSLPADEFYHADLIGLEVVDPGGRLLGHVRAIHDHGAGDVLEIFHPERERLIPFTQAAVPTVDLVAGRLVVDPPQETGGSDDAG